MGNTATKNSFLEEFRLGLADFEFVREAQNTPETWVGEISVEWVDEASGRRDNATHKVAIILPEAFPYAAPIVISKDVPPLPSSWHLNPEPLQSLCLWVPDAGWQPNFSAHRLLGRMRDWFCNHHTGNWPAGSQVPDLHQYLEKIGTVLLGEGWQPPAGQLTGRFTFWHSPKLAIVVPSLAATNPESGSTALEPEERLTESILFGSKHTKRMNGAWFRLPEPLVPPDNLSEILAHIDSSLKKPAGWARDEIIKVEGGKTAEAGFPIALGYSGSKCIERWLFLWVRLSAEGAEKRFRWSSPSNLPQVRLQSFQTAPAKGADLLRRVAYLGEGLKSKRVIIFGIGALGSSVSLLLAKSGVGELRVVDSEDLLPGNVMRHVCGLNDVGSPKTLAMRRTINRHNPDCVVECFESSWVGSKLQTLIKDCDLVIDTTASPNFSLRLNELCLEKKQPFVVAAAYRRAAIGRIIAHTKENDPCIACYTEATENWSEDDYPVIPLGAEETFVEDGCGSVTEEGSALDIEAVANLAARVSVRYLQGNVSDGNLAILVNEPLLEATNLLANSGTHWRTNARVSNCSICGK